MPRQLLINDYTMTINEIHINGPLRGVFIFHSLYALTLIENHSQMEHMKRTRFLAN